MSCRKRAFSLIDLLVTLACLVVGLAVLIPTLGGARGEGFITRSLENLRVLAEAHSTYAADWDGRQWTMMPDNLTEILGGWSYPTSYDGFPEVPAARLGFDCDGEYFESKRGMYIQGFHFVGNCSLGNFRAFNTGQFNAYVNGKVYDRTFWAPRDPTLKRAEVREFLALPCEWPGGNAPYFFPTYCMSMSALYNPLCWANDDIGQTRPLNLEFGHQGPTLTQALHPSLKTFMLEHYWLNPPPNPKTIPNTGGVPWFFNMSQASIPATLFYDGHTRLMPHREAMLSDDIVLRGGGPSLIASTDPGCFGSSGYFEWFSFYEEEVSSYHVFTADGILGRDTIFE